MKMDGAGGSPGGFGAFFGGLAMLVAGGYLFLQRVHVTSGFWSWFGPNTFGLTLVPLLVGIGFLFFDGKSKAGWLLTAAGALLIVIGVIANLQVWFASSTLFDTLLILGLMAGGIGLVARGVRGSGQPAAS